MKQTPDLSLNNLSRALDHGHAESQSALERLRCELRFAAQLCDLHPARAAAWRPLLAAAVRRAESADAADAAAVAAAVAAVEALLAPLAETAKSYEVYAVGHAHIDMNWMWSWPETVGIVNDTFATVLRLMEEFPEFHFTQSQASIYRILEQHNPELLQRIAARVREGRWEVAASHWVEGDKNLAGAESLCRHLLYTRRYMGRLFGLTPEDVRVDWSPDTFGHAATLPTYLAQGGVGHYFLHRPGAHAEQWPQAFRWIGPDGASVIVFNGMRGGYNGVFCPRMMLDRVSSWYAETGQRIAPFLYGVGDHGGGPTRRDLLRFRELCAWPIFPRLRLTTAAAFFAELERHAVRLPEVRGELNFVFTGCYTSQSLLKRCNRLGENRLDDAERAAALGWAALGTAYPAEALESAWRTVLFTQFHDILPGSCVHDARTYSHGLFQESMATAGMVETRALRALAAAVDTRFMPEPAGGRAAPPACALRSGYAGGAGCGTHNGGLSQADGLSAEGERPFVLFNLEQGAREEVVEATLWENARDYANQPFHRQAFAVTAPDGTRCEAQILEKGTSWGHDFVRVAFPARVPALGYARYGVAERTSAAVPPPPGAWHLGRSDWPARYSFHDLAEEGLENAFLRVELDARTGGIRRLTDKLRNQDVIAPHAPAGLLEFGIERPHAMSAWAVDHAYSFEPVACKGLTRKADGPYVASLETVLAVRESEFTLTYELRAGDPRLYLRLSGAWREFGSARIGVPFVRLALPTTLTHGKLTCEIPFGALERPFDSGEEVPALQWALLRGRCGGREAGVLLANDGKHSHALDGGVLRVNLIRSTYEPDGEPEIGRHQAAFALQAVAADLSVAEATAWGRSFNHPLRVVATDTHPGRLPPEAAWLHVAPNHLVVQSVKQAEDGGALLLRLANPGAQSVTAVIAAGPALRRAVTGAREVDLLERDVPDAAPLSADAAGTVRTEVPAYGLRTLCVTLKKDVVL